HTSTNVISPLSLHDALPISNEGRTRGHHGARRLPPDAARLSLLGRRIRNGSGPGISRRDVAPPTHWAAASGTGHLVRRRIRYGRDRKSTRLNSSHVKISYAV